MVMEEGSELLKESQGLAPTGTRENLPVKATGPTRPQGLTDAEEQELKGRALALVIELAEADGSQEMKLADSIASLGAQAQRRAGTELELLRARVGDMLGGGGTGDEMSKGLVELRMTLNQINPHGVGNAGFARRVIGKVPLVGKSALKTLERIAVRY